MSWPLVKLGEVCRPRQHPTISTKDLTKDGYPVFGANGQIGFYETFTHDVETIAITCRGATCGTVNLVPAFSYITGNAMALDNLDTTRVDLRFLSYALRFRGLTDVISGSAQPQITRGPLLGIEIPLPPLSEQVDIASILDRADCLRELRTKALHLLDNLREAAFIGLFGTVERLDGTWPIIALGDIVHETKLGLVRGAVDLDPSLPHRYIRMNAITRSGELDLSDLKRTTASTSELREYSLSEGDFLFNTRNSRDLVGKSAVFRESGEYLFNNNIMRIRFKDDVVPEYVAELFRRPAIRAVLDGLKSGTTNVFAIYWKDLQLLKLPIPPIELQRRFAAYALETANTKTSCHWHLSKLDKLFSSLQHRAFCGELTAKTVERALERAG